MCPFGLPVIATCSLLLYRVCALVACLFCSWYVGVCQACHLALSLAFFGMLSDASPDCLCALHALLAAMEVLSWLSGGATHRRTVVKSFRFFLLPAHCCSFLPPVMSHASPSSTSPQPMLTGWDGWPARAGHKLRFKLFCSSVINLFQTCLKTKFLLPAG